MKAPKGQLWVAREEADGTVIVCVNPISHGRTYNWLWLGKGAVGLCYKQWLHATGYKLRKGAKPRLVRITVEDVT